MKRSQFLTAAGYALFVSLALVPARAADVELLPDGLISPTSDELTPPDRFKKAPPWRIGVSLPGVGNTWLVQAIEEMKYEASLHKEIGEFIFTEADWKTTKQVADVEDLLTKKVDALIVAPIAVPVLADQIAKAKARGIVVVAYGTGQNNADSEITAGGRIFGEQGGTFLRQILKGRGSIWAFRGVAGVEEDQARYDGFRTGIEGSDLKIDAEVFGDWNYAKAKGLCENLVLSGKKVDGIWFSGAEMTRACIDVFKQTGRPLVPMTGEGNNGFLRVWKETGIESIAPIYAPGIDAALVRATVALLGGKQLRRTYSSSPQPILKADLKKYFRPDLNDAFWVPSTLPEDKIEAVFKK